MLNLENLVLPVITNMANAQADSVVFRLIGDDLVREITWKNLDNMIRERVDCFERAGIRTGDRVMLIGQNSPEWMGAFFALVQMTATVVPLDNKLTNEQFQQLLLRVEPAALVLDAEQLAQRRDLAAHLVQVHMESGAVVSAMTSGRVSAEKQRPDDLDPETIAIVFTSGSTAQPKGVVLSRNSVAHAVKVAIPSFRLTASSELLCVLPFHHVLGIGFCMATIQAGGTVTLLQQPRGDLLLKVMNMTHTTIMPGIPRLFELIVTNLHTQIQQMPAPLRGTIHAMKAFTRLIRDHSGLNPGKILFRQLHRRFGGHLESFISGGAALPAAVRNELEAFGFDLFEGYGLTETTSLVSVNTREQKRAGTVGKAFPGLEARIANPDVSGEGEILVRGPTTMQGYFHDPEATAEIFREDGWLRTGDVGRLDRDGFISITGRIKELIVTAAGKNISPEAVEWEYRDLDGVKDLAVLGMPGSTHYGEEVHAAVVPLSSDREAEQRIYEAIAERSARVPSYMHIQRIHLVRDIPRTTTLKIRRGALRQMLTEKPPEPGESHAAFFTGTADDSLRDIIRIVREIILVKNASLTIGPGSTLKFDLGIDSLGFLEMVSSLNREFNVNLDLQQVQACKTIDDVTRLLQAQSDREPEVSAKPSLALQIPPLRTPGMLRCLRVLRRLFTWVWHLDADGLDNLPENGPFILCPNHECHFDSLFVLSCLPAHHQATLCTFAKREHFERRLTRIATWLLRAVPVDRMGDPRRALETGATLLQAGRTVLIHPEGTRTRDGTLQPFRRGAAHLALQTGAPLIPVRIDGAFAIYPSHALFPKLWSLNAKQPLRLRIHIGSPIFPPPNAYHAEAERKITEQLRRKIEQLGEHS